MSIPIPVILDISEHQPPSDINYDKLADAIDGVIVRIQYGSRYLDKHYKTHIAAFQKRGIPVAVYAWIRGINKADMEQEAIDFYNRAKAYDPVMWWLDVEEQSMGDMRGGTEAYRSKLKSLGAKKIGVYVANHLYSQFNLDTSKFDGIWIPTYGANNGQYNGSNPTATSNFNLHQYTSNGQLSGYVGPLDLSRIAKGSFSDFFGTTGANNPSAPSQPDSPITNLEGDDIMFIYEEKQKNGTGTDVYLVIGNKRMHLANSTWLKEAEDLCKRYGGTTKRQVYGWDNFGLRMIKASTELVKP